jgi:hypothetical protein
MKRKSRWTKDEKTPKQLREMLHEMSLHLRHPGAAFDRGFRVSTDFGRPIHDTSGAHSLRIRADWLIIASMRWYHPAPPERKRWQKDEDEDEDQDREDSDRLIFVSSMMSCRFLQIVLEPRQLAGG